MKRGIGIGRPRIWTELAGFVFPRTRPFASEIVGFDDWKNLPYR